MKIELPKQEQIINTLERNQVKFAGLFGSRAKGLANKGSDYDFLLSFNENKKYSLFDIARVKIDLEDILQTDVDVITLNGLNPKIKNEVLNSLVVIYGQH